MQKYRKRRHHGFHSEGELSEEDDSPQRGSTKKKTKMYKSKFVDEFSLNASPEPKKCGVVSKVKLKMKPKENIEMENAFNFKEFVPTGHFQYATQASIHRLDATRAYMMDLVAEGGHPSLTKTKPQKTKAVNNDLAHEGSKSVF